MTAALARWRGIKLDGWALILSFVLMPIAIAYGLIALPTDWVGRDPWLSAWLWAPLTLCAAGAVFLNPPARDSIRSARLYLAFLFVAILTLLWTTDLGEGLAFLGRLLVFVLLYFAAWSATRDLGVIRSLRTMSVAVIVLIAMVYLISTLAGESVDRTVEFQRLMGAAALNLIPLFVMATVGRTSRFVLALGLLVCSIAFAANARMVGLVLVALLLLSPSWVVPWHRRALGGVVVGAALAILLSSSFFGSRWFISDQGTIWDVVGISSNLDLSGRGEIWSALVDRCDGSWLIGNGVGSANHYAHDFRSTVYEPHNEYLRIACDTGVIGSTLLWAFVVAVAFRAARTAARQRRSAAASHAALQMAGALLLVAITDNPLTATIQFFAPVAIVWAWSDRLSVVEQSVSSGWPVGIRIQKVEPGALE